jgi:hypothetical protein
MRFGPTFKRPSKKAIRLHRRKTVFQNSRRMFEAEELRTIIDAAPQPLKAMIMLGVNCGFGDNDCGTLPKSALDLDGGWVDYPRPKNGNGAPVSIVAGNTAVNAIDRINGADMS